MTKPEPAAKWQYDESRKTWIRFRVDDPNWMYGWIDVDDGFYNIDIPEGDAGRLSGSLSDFKGDIAKCMAHIDNELKKNEIGVVGGLPAELAHMKKSYTSTRKNKMSDESAEGTYGPTLDMAAQAVKMGAGITLATKAQQVVNDTAAAFLKKAVGEEYATMVDHPLVQIFLAFGSPMFVNWITYQFEGMFGGQEDKIRAACKAAMIGQTIEHMAPALEAIKESMGALADVGSQVIKMNMLADMDLSSGAKETVKETVKEKANVR